MDGTQGYSYLGIIESNKSEDTVETAEKIKVELLARVERLYKTKLNGKIYSEQLMSMPSP
ncbi:hypothetical protein NUSPORA_02996 [Nucleospora cyclopteri]